MKIYKSLKDMPALAKDTSLAIGLFDGIHLGHKAVIRTAVKHAAEAGLDSAVLTFQLSKECHPNDKEANKRITSSTLFFRQLKNMGVKVVFCPSFEEVRGLSPEDFVTNVLAEKLRAKFVACGKDFRFGKNAVGTAAMLQNIGREQGISVQPLPLVMLHDHVISSTLIREMLEAGDIEEANALLGHLYAIDFEVVHGNRIGRTLGTPTINQPFPPHYLIPKYGIYASVTYLDEKLYTSVTSIGVRPTVGSDGPLSETYIQNYHGDLYGQNVQVALLKYLREEIKYPNLELLRQQIQRDSEKAAVLGAEYLKRI